MAEESENKGDGYKGRVNTLPTRPLFTLAGSEALWKDTGFRRSLHQRIAARTIFLQGVDRHGAFACALSFCLVKDVSPFHSIFCRLEFLNFSAGLYREWMTQW